MAKRALDLAFAELCNRKSSRNLHSAYDTVKELILKAYELVPEAYMQKVRKCRKEKDPKYVEFARTKEQLFDRWCS